ncbi:HpcH/HpaI aldolase/citrate lyase family protein [Chachezhania sediminis]|uniref:HpcH/HpaI aldolase/citrate lyase family protein n=1 Tax=Chachezhania sediminis TaxID=2599291 RepID=UPI00131D4D13|nr:CoA ester lyase [Chachezhania sediminis]
MTPLTPCDFPLFVPASRPERFEKALTAAHDAVIFDLEDAVAADAKTRARDALADHFPGIARQGRACFVRINARDTPWHSDDVALCADLDLAGVMLPKAERADDMTALAAALPPGRTLLALIETAAGLVHAAAIARSAGRLVFGSVDFCADLGCDLDRPLLLRPRQDLVIASRLAGLPAPVDGVTTALKDPDLIRDDAAHAAGLGMGGKLLIHPFQIPPALQGFAPSSEMVAWAGRVLAASAGEAVAVDGMMIDAPVLARARSILARNASATDLKLEG